MPRPLIALATLLLALAVPLVAVCAEDDRAPALTIEALRDGSTTEAQPRAGQEPSPAPAPTPTPKRVAVSADEVLRGPADVPRVSLVINAGSGYPPATEILDVLASRNVKTTFFLMGWWAERNPEIVRRIYEEGHEIASHGYQEFDLTLVSDAAVIADIERADTVLRGITGQSTRPLWSPSAGYRDARVRRIAATLGYRPIIWTQDSGDWRTDATADGVLRQALVGGINGSIIVLHLDSPQSRATTAAVLGRMIDTLRERGLEPVTITELIGE